MAGGHSVGSGSLQGEERKREVMEMVPRALWDQSGPEFRPKAKVYVLYEQMGETLKRVHEGSHETPRLFKDFLVPADPEEKTYVLLYGQAEELPRLMSLQEAQTKNLVYPPRPPNPPVP